MSILRWKGDTGIRYEHLKVEGRHMYQIRASLGGRETHVSDMSILRWKGDTGIRYEHLKVEGRHRYQI